MIALALQYIPAEVWGIIAALIAGFAAWATGRQSGKAAAKTKAAEQRADDLQTANEVQHDNAAKSGDAVRADLDQWMRDK